MLKRRGRIERIDNAIGDTEQVFRIAPMEVGGWDTSPALRSLEAVEGILIDYHQARDMVVGSRCLTGRSPRSRGGQRNRVETLRSGRARK